MMKLMQQNKSTNCKEFKISEKNPTITGEPTHGPRKQDSKYYEVYWDTKRNKLRVNISTDGTLTCAGFFDDEIDAAKRVNQLCEKYDIAAKYPEISRTSSISDLKFVADIEAENKKQKHKRKRSEDNKETITNKLV